MDLGAWSLVAGLLLVFMAVCGSVLQRLPLSTSMLYLGAGALIGPWGLGLASPDAVRDASAFEHMAEVVVVISLFACGLKLSPALRDGRWALPARLAITSMVLTVGAIAGIAYMFLDLPLGACIVLGGILAPTDPVLASDVQVTHPTDRDRLRFALTGEGGLNDGTAFPFVLLGLGLLGLEHSEDPVWQLLLVHGVVSPIAGLALGGALGVVVGRFVLYLRREHKEAVGLDDFLALGLVALSYGAAILLEVNGFLAVFAAGVAMRYLEESQGAGAESSRAVDRANVDPDTSLADAVAVDPKHASTYMAHAMLSFIEQVGRIGELAAVLMIGALLWSVQWEASALWFVPLLLLVVRPLAVLLGLAGSRSSAGQRWLIGWFGIRGVGSLFYLMYAIGHGLPRETVGPITALTLATVVTSIVAHGISVTPLMAAYERATGGRRRVKPSRRAG